MVAVKPERQVPVRLPVRAGRRQPFALHRHHHGVVPAQDVDAQVGTAVGQGAEEIAQSVGQAVLRALGHEFHAAVDVPAEDKDGVLGARQRFAQRAEIGVPVDEHGKALARFDTPAVAPRFQRKGGRFLQCMQSVRRWLRRRARRIRWPHVERSGG
ncbi:hypothetical protein D3C81_1601600 [compost metagenome]